MSALRREITRAKITWLILTVIGAIAFIAGKLFQDDDQMKLVAILMILSCANLYSIMVLASVVKVLFKMEENDKLKH